MAFDSWVPVYFFNPIHVYLPCIACQFCSITVLIYGILTWKRRVNHLFSALVLKPAHGITLLLTTCSGSCSLELTTKRSSWLLQNNSHLFFQEIGTVCGRLPKPRGAGLTFTWVCGLLLLFLYSSDTHLQCKLCWMLGSIDTGIYHWPGRSLTNWIPPVFVYFDESRRPVTEWFFTKK